MNTKFPFSFKSCKYSDIANITVATPLEFQDRVGLTVSLGRRLSYAARYRFERYNLYDRYGQRLSRGNQSPDRAELVFNSLSVVYFLKLLNCYSLILYQGSSTRGPRAACGPRASYVRPVKSISQNTVRYEY